MNARIKLVTLGLGAAAASAVVLTLTERSAKTQTTNPFPPVELVSQKPDGNPPNGNSNGAVANADGRCIAFYSDATNLVPLDNNGYTDVFLYDRDAHVTTLVSVGANGDPANGPSQAQKFRPAIDGGCTTVAFSSDASNLVAGDTNRKTDIFARDLGAATTRLVSIGLGGAPADGASSFASMAGDNKLIAFQSVATNLVADDTNRASDIFVADEGGAITRVSVGAGGAQANGSSITPSISADGHCVAFASAATNLLPGGEDTNGVLDIYVECDGVVTCRASVSSSGAEADKMSFLPALNSDGTIVAFKSNATNLVPGDLNQSADVFVHNCTTGETQRASVGDEGQEGNDIAIPPSISGDGRFVAFGSFASNLLQGQSTGGFSQVYVRDLQLQTTELISSSLDGQPGNGSVPDLPPSITLDGQFVAFESLATDLIARNTQGYLDTYIRANVTLAPPATRTNTPPPTPTPTKPVPCTRDTDCPVGQVCGSEGFCVTAPTPTPTIACNNDNDCPTGLFCINGVCRDISTPTVTPTPLPTCVTDEDCPPGTECKAFVCVPPRPCNSQLECRGIREACLDGFCECGGDCNTDGIVFGSEITKMVCIIGGQCNINVCPAGDINQDGSVTAGDVTLAVLNLGLGCPGEGSPLIYALDRTTETRTLEIGNITGIPGEYVNITIAMAGGEDVTTAQVDILYDQSQLQVSETEPACTLDPRMLDEGSFEAEVRLPQVPTNPPGIGRLRVAVIDKMPPIDSFGPGPVFQCKFRIQPAAAPGSGQLNNDPQRLEIADPGANPFNAQVTGGAIQINPRPPCVSDDMCPDGTECKGNECRPIIMCDGPMAGPGQCLDNRQACVNDQCECVGDCDLDGRVRANEITKMINIINGVAPPESCPAADFAGDGVRANDITKAINNINLGCP
ncbi:MAG TPA: Dickkopf N-terminal cysteine-rich domain-containing protein [Candidatus Dormibacteraeota bacterium]|nr:Dickkopf N-terminal cysteine-rich domain-containing protein [Candidatus Dormibacteraeota bacterium]